MLVRTRVIVGLGLGLMGAGAASAVPPAAAASPTTVSAALPAFQPGLWEYRRTMTGGQRGKPQVATVQKCSDPTKEIRDRMTSLTQKGCQFAPLKKQGDRYLTSWVCPTASGVVSFRNLVTVLSATSYEDSNEARHAQLVTHSVVDAKRLGDCPAGAGAESGKSPAASPSPAK